MSLIYADYFLVILTYSFQMAGICSTAHIDSHRNLVFDTNMHRCPKYMQITFSVILTRVLKWQPLYNFSLIFDMLSCP